MSTTLYHHLPVLLDEVVEVLSPQPGQNFVDGTLGGGSYSLALLRQVQPGGKVLSIDLDPAALHNYSALATAEGLQDQAIVVHGNFGELQKILHRENFTNVSGFVVDLGLNTYLLESSGRGFSFQQHEPLDMRYDPTDLSPNAAFLLKHRSPEALASIFREYGEEPLAQRLAEAVIKTRMQNPITMTTHLVDLIKSVLPARLQHKWADTARRVFQALRIAVNYELENLQAFLSQALDLLLPGGRLAVVSFHSLEDRIVKQFMVAASTGCICPSDFPECRCGLLPKAKLITKKPISPSEAEITRNPRSRSAHLRVLEKLAI